MDQFGCPANYGELYECYIGVVKTEVARAGIDRDNIEDVSHEIIIKFWQKDFLAKYDPVADQHGVPWQPKRRPRFGTLLRTFVRQYVRQDLDKQHTRERREPVRLEAPAYIGENGPVMYVEVIGATEEIGPSAELRDLMRRGYERLLSLPVKGKRDLARTFEVMLSQAEEFGKVDRREVAASLGVSPAMASELMSTVRRELVGCGITVP